MKKNTASLVLAIIGAVFGLIGGILWAACASAEGAVGGAVGDGGVEAEGTIYMVCYILFGIGGAVLSLVGGIQSFNHKKGGLVCSILGFLFQVAVLIASCVHVGGFSFLLELCTLVAIILLLVQVIMAARKPQPERQNQQNVPPHDSAQQ